MGSELIAACIFCGMALLGQDFVPRAGITGEFAASYSTLQRQRDLGPEQDEISNVTPKFVLIGLRGATFPPEGLGAGTPAREWRVRYAPAPSHLEQDQRPLEPGRTTANGTGRYENFSGLYRLPLGARDSIEAAYERRTNKSTEALNFGGENYQISEQRLLSADRQDGALGWRHRLAGIELALAARTTDLISGNATAGQSAASDGYLYGASGEVRVLRGRFLFAVSGEALRGRLDLRDESQPDFRRFDTRPDASLQTLAFSVVGAWKTTDVFLSADVDRANLPFVAVAVLGTESFDFDHGFRARSRSRDTNVELGVRTGVASGVWAHLLLRATYGDESVTFTDSRGALPPEKFFVHHRGSGGKGSGTGLPGALGSPSFTVAVGAEFQIGAPRR